MQRLRAINREGNAQSAQPDPQLQQAIGEQRPGDPVGKAGRNSCSSRQARHVGCEHRRHGEIRGSEYECEFAGPRGLVDQARDSRKEKTDQEQGERCVSAHSSGCLPERHRRLACARPLRSV